MPSATSPSATSANAAIDIAISAGLRVYAETIAVPSRKDG